MISIPQFLIQLGRTQPQHRKWVESLPGLIRDFKQKWELSPIGDPYLRYASCSYVAPYSDKFGDPVVLKIGLPHNEAKHEIDGLLLLEGESAVQLLDYDREQNVMLLECCIPGSHLADFPEPFQDEVIVRQLARIWSANYGEHPYRNLKELILQWNLETSSKITQFSDPKLAMDGCCQLEDLADSNEPPVFLATDLHAGNILRAEREQWMVIDIKPYIGDPAYDLTQHLLNCKQRLRNNPVETIQRLTDLSGVDGERLKSWTIGRLATSLEKGDQELAQEMKIMCPA